VQNLRGIIVAWNDRVRAETLDGGFDPGARAERPPGIRARDAEPIAQRRTAKVMDRVARRTHNRDRRAELLEAEDQPRRKEIGQHRDEQNPGILTRYGEALFHADTQSHHTPDARMALNPYSQGSESILPLAGLALTKLAMMRDPT